MYFITLATSVFEPLKYSLENLNCEDGTSYYCSHLSLSLLPYCSPPPFPYVLSLPLLFSPHVSPPPPSLSPPLYSVSPPSQSRTTSTAR